MNGMGTKPWFVLLRAALLAALLAQGSAAIAQRGAPANLAVATDLRGKATLVSGQKPTPVGLLQEFGSGARIELAPQGRLVVVYYASGEEFAFAGPATVRIDDREPASVAGSPPQRRTLGFSGTAAGKPAVSAQAAAVMRNIPPRTKLLSPLAGVLLAAPEFRWESPDAAGAYAYQLTLRETGGAPVHEAQVAGTRYRLPEGVALREGVKYEWEVAEPQSASTRRPARASFVVATAEQRSRVEQARAASRSTQEGRVAFAAWLESEGFLDEALGNWQALARERPDEPAIAERAGKLGSAGR